MSVPGSAQPSPRSDQRKLIVASIAGALALLGVIANFLPWRSFSSEFVYGVTLRDITVDSVMSGLSYKRTIEAQGITGTEDIGSYSTTNPTLLIAFIVLAAAGVVLIAIAKAPRVGAVLVGLAGAALAAVAAYRMMLDGALMFGGGEIDVTDPVTFFDRALENGELSTGAGAYLAIAAGLLMVVLGAYAAIRPVTPAATVAPDPSPYAAPPFPQAPTRQPHQQVDPAAYQQQYPAQPPTWQGQPQQPGHPGQSMPPQNPNQPPWGGQQ